MSSNMLNFFKKKQQKGTQLRFKIDGMHCTSCSINIDGELEETEGVVSSRTSYAKATTSIIFDDKKVSSDTLKSIIENLGYKAQINNE